MKSQFPSTRLNNYLPRTDIQEWAIQECPLIPKIQGKRFQAKAVELLKKD